MLAAGGSDRCLPDPARPVRLPPRDELEGISLRPVVGRAREAAWQRPAICTFGPGNHSLRDERYRYTVYADGSQELYDHQADPNEWQNLVDRDGNTSPRAPRGDRAVEASCTCRQR